jgi:acetyltransferase-like isoleucine patch superfamily enzyme
MKKIPLTLACSTFIKELRLRWNWNINQFKMRCHLYGRGRHFFVSPYAVLAVADLSRFKIGEGVHIGEHTVIDISYDPRQSNPASQLSALEIGDHTYIGPFNNIRASGGLIRIGTQCMISQFVTIVASNHSTALGRPIIEQPWPTDRTGVSIGNDVWIGAGSCILPGVTIGSGAIIAANSVVTRNVESNAIVAGSPARTLRFRQ